MSYACAISPGSSVKKKWSQVKFIIKLSAKKKMEGFEEDPAAAFLAREQDELAGIAADTLGMETSTTRAEV